MNAGWIVLAVCVGGAIVRLAMSQLRRRQIVDLGTVSHQWIAEQRLGRGHDRQR